MNFTNEGGFYPVTKEHDLTGSWIFDPWLRYVPVPISKAEEFVIQLAEEGHEGAKECVKQGLLTATQGNMKLYHFNVYLPWEGVQHEL